MCDIIMSFLSGGCKCAILLGLSCQGEGKCGVLILYFENIKVSSIMSGAWKMLHINIFLNIEVSSILSVGMGIVRYY